MDNAYKAMLGLLGSEIIGLRLMVFLSAVRVQAVGAVLC